MAASPTLTLAATIGLLAQHAAQAPAAGGATAASSVIPYQPELITLVGACLGLAAIAAAVNQSITAWRNLRGTSHVREITPQPLTVSPATRYATLEELETMRDNLNERLDDMGGHVEQLRTDVVSVRAELTGLRAELHNMESRANSRDESRAVKLHDRINEILAAVSEMRGELNTMQAGK